VLKLRRKVEVVRRIAEVYPENLFLGKALALGYKVLTERGWDRFESLVLAGRYGEAGAYALAVAKSPAVLKFGNWPAPKGGFRELVPLLGVLSPLGDLEAMEAVVRLKEAGDEAEALLLLELHEAQEPPEVIARVSRAMVAHMGLDRKLRASEVTPPVVGANRNQAVRVGEGGEDG